MTKKKDLVTLLDFSGEEIREILDLAEQLKKKRPCSDHRVLKDRTGVLIFEKPSLRTRVTFETAIHELAGHPINLEATMVRMGERESVADVARNLERWVHFLVVRTFRHETIVQLARFSSIPVINALTDSFHPCQALAFGLTLRERTNDARNQKIVFVGDGNNVCSSLMLLCTKLGHDFTLACPKGYETPAPVLEACALAARQSGSFVKVSNDPVAAVADATVIYTDVWASMGQEEEAEKRRADFADYQINDQLLGHAPADVLVSHCLPAHRGEEITSEVIDSDHSVAFDEAENRLHVQKAVIVNLFS